MEPPPGGFRPPPPPPRPAKAKKKPAGPKKPPQRGLGVEQLERLRLQEQWKKVTDAHPTAGSQLHGSHHHQDQPLQDAATYGDNGDVETHAFQGPPLLAGPRGPSLSRFSSAPAPAGADYVGGRRGETTSLQRDRRVFGGVAGGFQLVGDPAALPAADSAVPYNSALDRYRVAMVEASLQVGNGAFTEFPSSQTLHCSEQCDVCGGVYKDALQVCINTPRSARRHGTCASYQRWITSSIASAANMFGYLPSQKKRVWEEELGVAEGNGEHGEGKNTLDLLGAGRRRTAASAERTADEWRETTETEVKEFMFFPGGGSSSHSGSWAMEGRRMTAGDASPYRSSRARSGTQLDLSLKLSF